MHRAKHAFPIDDDGLAVEADAIRRESRAIQADLRQSIVAFQRVNKEAAERLVVAREDLERVRQRVDGVLRGSGRY